MGQNGLKGILKWLKMEKSTRISFWKWPKMEKAEGQNS